MDIKRPSKFFRNRHRLTARGCSLREFVASFLDSTDWRLSFAAKQYARAKGWI